MNFAEQPYTPERGFGAAVSVCTLQLSAEAVLISLEAPDFAGPAVVTVRSAGDVFDYLIAASGRRLAAFFVTVRAFAVAVVNRVKAFRSRFCNRFICVSRKTFCCFRL